MKITAIMQRFSASEEEAQLLRDLAEDNNINDIKSLEEFLLSDKFGNYLDRLEQK
jgi:hypothetical protein